MQTAHSLNIDTILYRVRPGDNLTAIIKRYYGAVSLQQKNDIIRKIQADNPKLINPRLTLNPMSSRPFRINGNVQHRKSAIYYRH